VSLFLSAFKREREGWRERERERARRDAAPPLSPAHKPTNQRTNKQKHKRGYNIGVRIVDEYLAKTRAGGGAGAGQNAAAGPCATFRDAAEAVARHALPLFLNVAAAVGAWSPDGLSCSLLLTDNPFADFVELPDAYKRGGLSYCQLLAGAVRGALAQVAFSTDVRIARDALRDGGGVLELRVTLKEARDEAYPFRDDD
jgi:trafficking protein particle complex subunit 3